MKNKKTNFENRQAEENERLKNEVLDIIMACCTYDNCCTDIVEIIEVAGERGIRVRDVVKCIDELLGEHALFECRPECFLYIGRCEHIRTC